VCTGQTKDCVMKIAQVAPLFESVPPKLYGGTELVVSSLTEELVRLGHEVTLFASGDSVTSAQLVPGCKESLRLSTDCRDHLAFHLALLEEVFSQRSEFDIIHFHTDYLHFPISQREQAVQVTTLHGRLDIPELSLIYRRFAEMPVISISDAQRRPLAFANWQGTVHHGLPEDRHAFNERPGKYLAFLGRISPEKGVDRAIEIATQAGLPLKIAAKIDRVDRDYFEAEIRPLLDNPLVEFVGEIGLPEKTEFLGNAMALLFPIDWPEPFGLVMIEAMACGTPVVAFPKGSVPEIIEHGRSGFVVSSVSEAVEAVDQLAKIPREECRASFEQRFTASRMAEDYLVLYKRLIWGVPESVSLAHGVPVG